MVLVVRADQAPRGCGPGCAGRGGGPLPGGLARTGAIDRFGSLDAGSWIALAALGLGATLGGYVMWSMALRGLEPSRAMVYLYCVPPLAVAIGALFLDEPVTLWLVLGGALVIGGVAVAQRGTPRKAGMAPSACTAGADGQPCRP